MSRHLDFTTGRIVGPLMKFAVPVLLGAPIALQDFLLGISFLIILAIVNTLGVTASAGVGVAERVCTFIMLIPMSFMQSMSAFVAQNKGAGLPVSYRAGNSCFDGTSDHPVLHCAGLSAPQDQTGRFRLKTKIR